MKITAAPPKSKETSTKAKNMAGKGKKRELFNHAS